MFQRIAALPLALSSLFLFSCDDGGDEGNAGTDGSTGAVTATTGADSSSTDPGSTSGASTTDESTTDASTTTEGDGSTGLGSSSGEESGGSSTGAALDGISDVAGTYIETYGPGKKDFQTHIVTGDTWTIDFGGDFGMSVLTYEEVDDQARWVAGDDGAGTFARYDWDIDGDGNLRYCSAVFGAETLQAAIDAPPSDRDDLDGVGCGGMFAWSLLVLDEG